MWALFIPALVGALAGAMGSFIGRAIIALGIGTITYTGLSVAIASFKTSVITSVSSLPSDAVALVGYLWVDKALSIIFSAVVIALSMRLIGGSLKKMVIK